MRWMIVGLAVMAALPAKAQDAPVDPRGALTEMCMTEAKRRGAAMGAQDVSIIKLRDTDIDGPAKGDMTARIGILFVSETGKRKVKQKTLSCPVKNGVIAEFRIN